MDKALFHLQQNLKHFIRRACVFVYIRSFREQAIEVMIHIFTHFDNGHGSIDFLSWMLLLIQPRRINPTSLCCSQGFHPIGQQDNWAAYALEALQKQCKQPCMEILK
jgi:hypothetical protein